MFASASSYPGPHLDLLSPKHKGIHNLLGAGCIDTQWFGLKFNVWGYLQAWLSRKDAVRN